MTREEAAIVLRNLASGLHDGTRFLKPEHEHQFRHAYDIAIAALKQPERKKGHWQHAQNNLFICSNCGRGYLEGRYDKDNPKCTAKFCYNCGCEMRGEEDESD